MLEHVASRAELTGVCQRLAAHYTALAEKESARFAAGYARLDKEREHYLRLIESCLANGLRQEVADLLEATWEYLDRQGRWLELLSAFEMRLTAARQANDRKDECVCLDYLGYTCHRCGEYEHALQWNEQGLAIARELSDKKEQCVLLNNIGWTYDALGEFLAKSEDQTGG
ncbi:MAG: hypothetical protein ACTFAK_01305 [Candidatus Electronema sp. VV]